MDSLFTLLGQKDFDIPAEVVAIKQYVHDEFQEDVEVIVRERDIVIAGRSAAFVATLRLRGPIIKQLANTKKRLTFRIG